MGPTVMRSVIFVVIALFLGAPAFAQDKPNAKDTAAIQKCIKTKTGRNWAWENCVGVVSEPCAKNEAAMSSSEIMACYRREQAVWDNIVNETFRSLREKLDDTQQQKLREMQRAWIVSRDKSCAFFYDYFEGSMANTMIAACEARETGRRALFLLGFLDDAEGK
jgi:uncharacterized protein YecT (DUF1311 family)